jgi:hypothetical protein
MPRRRGWIASGLWLAATVFFTLTLLAPAALAQEAAPAAAPPTPKRHKSHKAPPPLVLPPLPAGALTQLPMDQTPPTPATVGYQNGLLTISAQNSTLGEILRDVRKLTGASFDIPPHSTGADERVIVSLGPGAPRDVLAALLNGSSFNYVMLGSDSDPAALATVILTPKASATGVTQAAANANPGAAPPNGFPGSQPFNQQNMVSRSGRGQPANVEADDSNDTEDTADDTADDQTQPGGTVPNQPQPQDPNQPNAGPRTPEQILEMIQRQRPQPPTAVNPPPPQQ